MREGIKYEAKNHLEVLKPWGLTTEDYSLALAPSQENIASFEVKAQELSLADKGEYFVICPMGSYERKNLPLPLVLQLIRLRLRRTMKRGVLISFIYKRELK